MQLTHAVLEDACVCNLQVDVCTGVAARGTPLRGAVACEDRVKQTALHLFIKPARPFSVAHKLDHTRAAVVRSHNVLPGGSGGGPAVHGGLPRLPV